MERVYNQINCVVKIMKETGGYSPGEIYLYEKRDEKPKQIKRWDKVVTIGGKVKSVFDINSGNFHIVPVEYEEINKKIVEARGIIIEKLKKLEIPKGKINFGAGSKGVAGCPLVIEKYILVEKDGYDYMLCFERLYTTGKSVNSALGLFQFYKHPSNHKGINMINGKFEMCYPDDCKDGSGVEKSAINNKYDSFEKNKHIAYNSKGLPSIYELNDENVKDVCNAFIDFIKNN